MQTLSVILVLHIPFFCIGRLPADFNQDRIVNFQDLAIFAEQWLDSGGTPLATVFVAPSSASEAQKQLADYVCDGVADELEINAALMDASIAGGADANKASLGYGGAVYLLPGKYCVSDSDDDGAAIVLQNRVDLIGVGNLHSVVIHGDDNCGNVIYFKAKTSDYGVEQGQFRLKNLEVGASLVQSGKSWAIYIEDDGTTDPYDCIYENIYTTRTKSGGMYVKFEWASHYEQCTFEHTHGDGYRSNGASGTVFNACYFAHCYKHGCFIEGGSNIRFIGCSFDDNGGRPALRNVKGTGESGLYINDARVCDVSIIGCTASNNSGDGFEVQTGSHILFDSCVAYKNNWNESEQNEKAGFCIRGSTVTDCIFINCYSYYNDGENAPSNHLGAGFRLNGEGHILRGCKASGNNYGIDLMWSASNISLDVQLNGNSQDLRHFGSAQNTRIRFNRSCIDVFNNVAGANTSGIKAGITDTIPITSFDSQPDYPRTITVTGDSYADGKVRIEGISSDGRICQSYYSAEEIIVVPQATVESKVAWAKITKITRTSSSGSVDVGWGDKFGLSNPIHSASDVYKFVVNGSDRNVPDVNEVYGTIDCSPVSNGDSFVVYYKTF